MFADIVKVELKPIDEETYQESLKQTLQDSRLEINTNPIVGKALNHKSSVPRVQQASLFNYLK